MNARILKVALVLALIVTGAIGATIGVRAYRYHFVGRDTEGRYHFESEPEIVYQRTSQDANGYTEGVGVAGGSSVVVGGRDSEEVNVEQMQSDLEEIARLRAQGLGELVGVLDTQVNGHFTRAYSMKYTLADGRTITIGENAPNVDIQRTPVQRENDYAEVARLREQGRREVTQVTEYDLDGQVMRVLACRYVLADGREIGMGEGDPELPPPTKILAPEQIFEVGRIKTLGQGESLGTSQRQMYCKTFTFQTRRFTLADGTVVTCAEGTPVGGKITLTEADWDELKALTVQGAGEDLGSYEEEINGVVFVFPRTRYTLRDGTDVICSQGKRKP